MGLIDFLTKKGGKKDKEMAPAISLQGWSPTYSAFGNDVYRDVAVQQAVNCIASEVRKLNPTHVIRDNIDIIPVEDGIQAVLDNPNPYMTTADFLEKITYMVYGKDNAFVLPTYDNVGKLDGLYPLAPTLVEFQQDSRKTMYVKFSFSNGYTSTIPYEDVIHIRRHYSVDEFMGGGANGMPDQDALLKALELNHTLEESVSKALKASCSINGVVKYNSIIDEKKQAQALKEFTDALKNNESGLMTMDLKGEFIPVTHDPKVVDANTLKFADEKILRHFGVPLCILSGDYTKDQYDAFFQSTIEPFIKTLGQAFTKGLFTKRQANGFGHSIIFYPEDLVFMNMSQKLQAISLLAPMGAITLNEGRTMLGMKPLKELEGKRMMSLNYVDADKANQYQLGEGDGEGETVNTTESMEE